jgi:UDP-2,3-diacylglucosamine pyrophosphatase LpxH
MNRAVLISDLHLTIGADNNIENFFSDDPFRSFLQDGLLQPGESDEVDLILLGDTFDLWETALQNAEYSAPTTADIQLDYTGNDEVQRLQRVRQGHPAFFDNLAEFAGRPRCRLTFIPGNHDHTVVDASSVGQAIRTLVGGNVRFAVNFDRPDLALYAEHGSQWDRNNTYADFGSIGLDGECPGYFFVRLFWNRLKSLEPRLANYPTDWRQTWHYIMPILRSHPLALAQAVRFWWQYRRDGRVSKPIPFALEPALPGGAGVTADGPDILASGAVSGGHVFAADPEIEHALREAYHREPAVKQAIDDLRPAGAAAIPPADPALATGAFTFSPPAGLEGEDGAQALFDQNPTGRNAPLDESVYRFVLFGHTHKVGEKQLPNGAWYVNTGTWIGNPPPLLPVVVAECGGPAIRLGLGQFDGGRIRIADTAWHTP